MIGTSIRVLGLIPLALSVLLSDGGKIVMDKLSIQNSMNNKKLQALLQNQQMQFKIQTAKAKAQLSINQSKIDAQTQTNKTAALMAGQSGIDSGTADVNGGASIGVQGVDQSIGMSAQDVGEDLVNYEAKQQQLQQATQQTSQAITQRFNNLNKLFSQQNQVLQKILLSNTQANPQQAIRLSITFGSADNAAYLEQLEKIKLHLTAFPLFLKAINAPLPVGAQGALAVAPLGPMVQKTSLSFSGLSPCPPQNATILNACKAINYLRVADYLNTQMLTDFSNTSLDNLKYLAMMTKQAAMIKSSVDVGNSIKLFILQLKGIKQALLDVHTQINQAISKQFQNIQSNNLNQLLNQRCVFQFNMVQTECSAF